MARRIENPNADDLGQGGVELSEQEYEDLLAILASNGVPENQIDLARTAGFIAPIQREGLESLFEMYHMQSDVKVMAVCREGRFELMRDYILFSMREGSWPDKD